MEFSIAEMVIKGTLRCWNLKKKIAPIEIRTTSDRIHSPHYHIVNYGKSQILFRESVKVSNFGKILLPSDSASKMGRMTKIWHVRRRRYDAKCSKYKFWASYPKTWSNSKNFHLIEFSMQKYPLHVKITLKCSIILEILDMFYF